MPPTDRYATDRDTAFTILRPCLWCRRGLPLALAASLLMWAMIGLAAWLAIENVRHGG